MRWLVRPLRRIISAQRLKGRVGVFYHPEYAVEPISQSARASIVDAKRAEKILGALSKAGALRPGDVRSVEPATFQELLRIHSPSWLEDSVRPEVLGHVFGLDPALVEVDEIVRAQRRAVGGTMAAARAAASGELEVAFNVGGGFHHAAPEQGAGFCIYNDVAVAIAALRADGMNGPIAVVDLDYHQGDGTRRAFADDPGVLTLSMHGSIWSRVEAVADRQFVLPSGTGDEEYLAVLSRELPEALRKHRPRLIFYVAGNDVLGGDRLGDFEMSLAGVLSRDQIVTSCARKLGSPLVVTLGGGYSDLAWRATVSYLSWLLTGLTMRSVRTRSADGLERHFEDVRRSLDRAVLQSESDDLGLTMDDVIGDLSGPRKQQRLLGYYSTHGVELALERYGLMDNLRAMGFAELALDVEPADPARQIIRIRARKNHFEGPFSVLVEVVLKPRQVVLPGKDQSLDMLSLEWLLLQDPTANFTLEKPKLPGQVHPGLGRAREVIGLLMQVCKRLGLHGVVNRPGYYHVASVTSYGMHFLDPEVEGRFMAMREVLKGWDLAEATVAVDRGRLHLAGGQPVPWQPSDYVLPVSARMQDWFASGEYVDASEAERDRVLQAGLRVD